MASNDKYQRGKSGYSKHDEKAAKEYGQRDYATNTVMRRSASEVSKANPGITKKEARQISSDSNREAVYRRDVGSPSAYLHNTRTEEGREINRKNVKTQDEDRAKDNRPPMSKKWIEK